jgi:hypothetical protein
MRNADIGMLLDALDLAPGEPPVRRAVALLRAVRDEPASQLEAQPVGWLVARLLELRARIIGPILECVANCPACAAKLEAEVRIADLLALEPAHHAGSAEFTHQGSRIAFRVPTGADLLTLSGSTSAAVEALASCLLLPPHRDVDLAKADGRAALDAAIGERDPLACIELALNCDACGRSWREPLRPFEFVWSELQSAARRLIAEVARLAMAFGWREPDILALSEQRRRRYLEMLPK